MAEALEEAEASLRDIYGGDSELLGEVKDMIRKMKQQLGEQLGFMGKTSDVRMAQYESEARVPKIDLVKQMSQIFDVNTHIGIFTLDQFTLPLCLFKLPSAFFKHFVI